MGRLVVVSALLVLGGCELKLEAAPVLSDHEVCSWHCERCVGEPVGKEPYPFKDCYSDCKSYMTTQRCPERERDLLVCQVRNEDCRAPCETEQQALRKCNERCNDDKVLSWFSAHEVPAHCKGWPWPR